jgi:hypothetical protein
VAGDAEALGVPWIRGPHDEVVQHQKRDGRIQLGAQERPEDGRGRDLADLDLILEALPILGIVSVEILEEGGRDVREAARPFFGLLSSGSTASMDTPAWWNMGHRPVKFVDGVFPMDAPRVDMVFYTPLFGLLGSLGGPVSEAGQDWMRGHGPDLNSWVETLKAPAYPGTVNNTLAEQGAVMFHTLESNDTPSGSATVSSCSRLASNAIASRRRRDGSRARRRRPRRRCDNRRSRRSRAPCRRRRGETTTRGSPGSSRFVPGFRMCALVAERSALDATRATRRTAARTR